MKHKQRVCGFSLIELIVAIVVLAVGATGMLIQINQAIQHSADPQIFQQANSIARSYLEETLLNSFCDPDVSTNCPTFCSGANACTICSAGEASRDLFDDVCDYDSINDTAGAVDQTGTAIAGLEAYNVNVTVSDAGVTLQGQPSTNTLDSASGQVLRVDINVTHDNFADLDYTLTGYKANF